ncbi:transporter substrate-binding domain-containing protein [Lentibacter algarum]|uniref:transporter substrate-binding domain-containing protein n=1 Tax=Lentibacter algarum TaxID=576131 RepID=UPI001C070CAD|nr:transporter substrate-binding domain-containing protein [Lentibacter algarum]MBU2981014.1 transporter substrate-binding domain-containing protein [Lentibacter algarum]
MKLTNILGTVAALAITATAATAEIKIGFAAEAYPPFTAKNAAGEWEGFEVDLKNALCAAMEEECVVVDVAWDGIIPALLGGKIDAIVASMSITEERMKTINFSDKYYNTPAVLVAPKDMMIDGTKTDGKIIGVQVSTIHQNYAEKHFPNATVKTYGTFDEHNADLTAGRVDAVVGDSIAFADYLASNDSVEVKAELSDEEVFGPGVGVGLRKDDAELTAKFNAAIKMIRENGTYDEIGKKYFDFDIYGG